MRSSRSDLGGAQAGLKTKTNYDPTPRRRLCTKDCFPNVSQRSAPGLLVRILAFRGLTKSLIRYEPVRLAPGRPPC
jgi:hypothetical protein